MDKTGKAKNTDKTVNKSPKKKDGVCPYAKKCGGCDYQGIKYKKQLETKEANVKKLLKDFVKVSPIVGMENPYYYRHKVHAVFDCVARGQVVAGVYKKNTHDVVDIESCQIEDQEEKAVFDYSQNLVRDRPVCYLYALDSQNFPDLDK